MKNFILGIIMLTLTESAYAQQLMDNRAVKTQSSIGHWVLGVETDNLVVLKKVRDIGDKDYQRRIMPTVSYFVTRNLILGVGIPLGLAPRTGTYYSSGTVGQAGVYPTSISPKQIGVAPFIQQFIGQGKVKPFIGASYRYTYQQLDFSIRDISVYLKQAGNESELSVFTGLTYLISPKIGIDVKLRYGWQSGNHPYVSFPNLTESGYTSNVAYTSQTLSANIGLRLMIGKKG